MRRLIAIWIAIVAVAACPSSGTKQTKRVAAKGNVTTTTESRAIGLRTNADEEAELEPDQPLTAAQQAKLDVQLTSARKAALLYPTVADAKKAGLVQAGRFTP